MSHHHRFQENPDLDGLSLRLGLRTRLGRDVYAGFGIDPLQVGAGPPVEHRGAAAKREVGSLARRHKTAGLDERRAWLASCVGIVVPTMKGA